MIEEPVENTIRILKEYKAKKEKKTWIDTQKSV